MYCNADKLVNASYGKFSLVSRTMHEDDVEQCIRDESLVSHKVPKQAKCFISQMNWNILWFGVPLSLNKHDWYENIRFQILFTDLLQYYGNELRCYYTDRVIFPFSSSSRIVLTKRRINSNAIIELDFAEKGYPIWKDSCGIFYHAKRCDGKKHNVELLIDATPDIVRWLYARCDRVPVNHSDANLKGKDESFMKGKCHKFNKFGRICPYNKDRDTAEEHFNDIYSGFLGSSKLDEFTNENENRNVAFSQKTGSMQRDTINDGSYKGYVIYGPRIGFCPLVLMSLLCDIFLIISLAFIQLICCIVNFCTYCNAPTCRKVNVHYLEAPRVRYHFL